MRIARLAILLVLASLTAVTAETRQEEVQADISTREIAIESNFTGIDILIFGSIDYGQTAVPDRDGYGVIVVVRGPREAAVVRRKHRVAGIWVNGPGKVFASPPGFYAVLSSGPLRKIASDETLQDLGIGFNNLDFGLDPKGDLKTVAYQAALIRLRQEENLFQEHDDGVHFSGRNLFRANVALPVNVPIGQYTADVYMFRDGLLVSRNHSTLDVNKVGLERMITVLASRHPFMYGSLAVLLAVLAGLTGWFVFRRE